MQNYNLGDDYLNNIKAAIFDLDGTLVDSMWVWQQIDIDYLSEKGHAVPNNLNDEITHLSFSQTAEYFKNRFSIEVVGEVDAEDMESVSGEGVYPKEIIPLGISIRSFG